MDKADALRQKRRQTFEKLDELIQSVFLDMFGDPIVSSNFPKVKGKKLFELRSGKFKPKKHLDDKFEFPVYGGNGKTGYWKEYLIDKPTLVIGRVGAYCGNIHKVEHKSWITDNAIYIKGFKRELRLEFLYRLMDLFKFNRFADYSGQPKITQKPLLEAEMPLPPLREQDKFDEISQKIAVQKKILKKSESKLDKLFNSLLQKAFKGELNFSDREEELLAAEEAAEYSA